MSEKPIAYTAEVAARMRELVFSLENDLRDMESAARTVLGLSHAAKIESLDIPEELIAEGIHFVSGQAADLAGELSDRYYELFALVVHGRLPEEDECCQSRKARREQPNLSLRLAPEAGG
jgi:hypothetical protein